MQDSSIKIGLDKMSSKHLIGQCLDMTLAVLQELVHVYCDLNHFEFPPPNQTHDLLGYLNYMLDPSRFDKLIQTFLKENINYMKAFIKSWLFELKAIRNSWAHMTTADFDIRMVCRAFDTLSLLYSGFSGHPQYELYQKIELYRKQLLLYSIQQYHIEQLEQKMANEMIYPSYCFKFCRCKTIFLTSLFQEQNLSYVLGHLAVEL